MSAVDSAAGWLARLVAIPSVNPAHAGPRAGTPGERALAVAVADWIDGLGVGAAVELGDTDLADRPNVYAVIDGTSDRWVGIDVHLDTVGVEHVVGDPFSGEIRDGKLWGRGSVDTKAMLGATLAVLEELGRTGERPVPNLVVVGTSAEESGGFAGAEAFRSWLLDRALTLDELLIAEPTGCHPVYGHKGGLGIELTVRGTACHAAVPDQGENAIDAAAEMLLALREEHRSLQRGVPTTPLGHGTLTTTMITGGTARNIVPDACTVSVGRRLVPGEDPEVVREHIVEVARAACPLPVDVDGGPGLPAFYGDPGGSLLRRLEGWSGRPAEVTALGTNAFRYDAGVAGEMVVFGPGSIEQAHAAEEWCRLDELEVATEVVSRWLRSPSQA